MYLHVLVLVHNKFATTAATTLNQDIPLISLLRGRVVLSIYKFLKLVGVGV